MTKTECIENLIAIATKEVGTTEYPKNSNNVKYNTWYYGKNVYGDAYPWCVTIVQWLYNEINFPLPYKTASCSELLRWFKQNHPECVSDTPTRGSIAIYNFGHMGVVVTSMNNEIVSIEGNTSPTDSFTQDNGGGVYVKYRNKSLITAYINPFELFIEESDKKVQPINETRYHSINDVPEMYRDTVRELIENGSIKGRDNGDLDLNEDIIRCLVICSRMINKNNAL